MRDRDGYGCSPAELTELPSVRALSAPRGLGVASIGATDPYTAATNEILKSVATIGGEVVPIAAAFGDKKAAEQQAAAQALEATKLQTAQQALVVQEEGIKAKASTDTISAIAPYAGGALLLGAGLWGASKVFSSWKRGRK